MAKCSTPFTYTMKGMINMINQFKNGNLHIKFDKYDSGETIMEKLGIDYDLYPISEPYCLGNDCMAYDFIYNGGEYFYTISSYDIKKLNEGKTIKLIPIKDKEYIDNLMNNLI